jgi:hypothetical protein
MGNTSSYEVQPGAWPHRPGQYVFGPKIRKEEVTKHFRRVRIFPSNKQLRDEQLFMWSQN